MEESTTFLQLNSEEEQYCLLCLNRNPTGNPTSFRLSYAELGNESINRANSFQRLLRYLNIPVETLLLNDKGNGHVSSPDNQVKLDNPKWKVGLCDVCASRVDKFSKLYQQLETVRLEMERSFEGIHEELASSEKYRCGEEFRKSLLPDAAYNSTFAEILTIRKERINKCKSSSVKSSQKSMSVRTPRVKIQRLEVEQLDSQLHSGSSMPNEDLLTYQTASLDEEEEEAVISNSLEDVTPEPEMGAENANLESNYLDDNDNDDEVPQNSITIEDKMAEIPTSCFNSSTKKHKCGSCPSKEFSSSANYRAHYRSVHLKIRYKCKECGKQFHHNSHYNRHHLSAHQGVLFDCQICGKAFTQASKLQIHIRAAHCSVKVECGFCPASFTNPSSLSRHLRRACPHRMEEGWRNEGCEEDLV